MQVIKIKVTQTDVTITEKPEKITAENYNQIKCIFDLDEAFDNLIVRASFNGEYATVENGECFAPVLKQGNCSLGVYGYAVVEEKLERRISPSPKMFYVNEGSYNENDAQSDNPTPTELEEHYNRVKELEELGGDVMGFICNVLDMEAIERTAEAVVKRFGKVDILLNIAGGNMPGATIAPTGTFFDLKVEEFERVLNVNLTGTVIPTQVFLKAMVEQKEGCIVNFSSMSAFRPLSRICGYSAAKAGISNFTQFMANEVATKFGEGIRVNAIAPGFFLTEQNRALLTNPDGSYTGRGQDVIRQTPFKRFGKPEELNGTIQYLISDASRFVTGTVAVVDGGFNTFAI